MEEYVNHLKEAGLGSLPGKILKSQPATDAIMYRMPIEQTFEKFCHEEAGLGSLPCRISQESTTKTTIQNNDQAGF